ncbi:MAG: helix-turn-helix transcriptional regulator [Bacteroidota bacterium]
MTTPFRIKSITELHQIAGGPPPEHPLISLIRLEDIPELPADYPQDFIYEFYSIGFKKNLKGYIAYGRENYDFQEGVLGFTEPDQSLSFTGSDASEATGWILFFHKDFLMKSPLMDKIEEYGFFKYNVNEALHLSAKEEELIEGLFANMHNEYSQRIDTFSKDVLLSNLELLLTYSQRFYSRQFITRNDVDSSFLNRFKVELKKYFHSDELIDGGIPTVEYFAKKLNISSSYLSDMLKSLTGKTTKEHIHLKLIEMAKKKLVSTDQTVAEIAYGLGFEYPQYFNRLFKEKTGLTPKEFRMNVNA